MRALAAMAAIGVVLASGACGSDSSDGGREGDAPERPPGITARQYGDFELGTTTRAELERRLGPPGSVRTERRSTCLRYPAVDENGNAVREFAYEFCFRKSELRSASTVPPA